MLKSGGSEVANLMPGLKEEIALCYIFDTCSYDRGNTFCQIVYEVQLEVKVDVEVGGGEVANLMSGLKVGMVLCKSF